MISDLDHADKLQRHIQSQINAREIINGRPVTWVPTSDPRELVRRQAFLEGLGSDHFSPLTKDGSNGNELHRALSQYVRELAKVIAEVQP